MHVCFVSPYFPQPCGIASYTNYLAEALCSSDPSFQGTLIAEKPAQEHPNQLFHITGTFNRDDNYPEQVVTQIKATAPNIIHIQHEYGIFGLDDRFFQLLIQLRDLGIPTVVTLHTVHTRLSFNAGCVRPYLRHLLRKTEIEGYQRRIGELADLVIVHQENSIRQVLLRQGLSPNRVAMVPHGTRVLEETDVHEARKALCVETDTPLILAFGYLEPSKNLLLLIKAFRRVKACVPRAKLWLGGYVRFHSPKALDYRARCLRFIEKNGLENDVIFNDKMIPEEQVSHVLTAAEVACFVYNEDTHSSSGALHLAMGLGKAIVASRIPKFQELAEEVSDEILVNPRSAGELFQLLTRLLIDEPFRQYVKQRVWSYAQRTAWSCVAQQHRAIYDGLVSLRNTTSRSKSFN